MTFGKIGARTMLWPCPYVKKGLVTYFDSKFGLDIRGGTWRELITGAVYSASMSAGGGGARMLSAIQVPFSMDSGITLQYTIYGENGSWTTKDPLIALDSEGTTVLTLRIRDDWTFTEPVLNGSSLGPQYDGSVQKTMAAVTYENGVVKKYIGSALKHTYNSTMASVPVAVALPVVANKVYIKRALAYNRALTAAEIAANYAVDAIRNP